MARPFGPGVVRCHTVFSCAGYRLKSGQRSANRTEELGGPDPHDVEGKHVWSGASANSHKIQYSEHIWRIPG